MLADPPTIYRPQPGFQEQVLACSADIAIAGGSAGCGKSWTSIAETVRHLDNPGFRAVIFRRTSPELTGAGSIWEEAMRIYPVLGGRPRYGKDLDWAFPSGARVEFRHLQHESDIGSHQSKAYALIIFEEMTHFLESMLWFLLSRNRSTCGVTPYIRGNCNPDPDSFVAKLIAWWIDQETGYAIPERSGVVRWFVRDEDALDWGDTREEVEERHPELTENGQNQVAKSFTFIPGKLEDNPAMETADPGYRSRLMLLPLVLRERYLRGNWKVRASAGMYFKASDFEIVDEVPCEIVRCVRFWDRAASEPSPEYPNPDWTAGVKMAKLEDGRYIVLHVERLRKGPGAVERRIKNLAGQDGKGVTIGLFKDPGSAGKSEIEHARRMLDGYSLKVIPATRAKEIMAAPFSTQAEGGRVLLLRGPWNDSYTSELEAFPPKGQGHDDQVDGSSGAHESLQEVEFAYA